MSVYQRKLIEYRRLNKLCADYGDPLDRDGYRCAKCNKKHNENNKKDKDFYISHKICPVCRINKLFGQEKQCAECCANGYIDKIKSNEKLGREHVNKIHAEWSKNEYNKRIESGLCVRCGKIRNDKYKICSRCRQKIRSRRQTGKQELRKERYKQGLCYFCDNPIKDGYKVCEKHYQMNVEKANSNKAKYVRKKLTNNKILY